MRVHSRTAYAGIVVLQKIPIRTSAALGSSQADRTSFVDSVANLADHHIAASHQIHLPIAGRASITGFAGIAAYIALFASVINVRVLPYKAAINGEGQPCDKSISDYLTHLIYCKKNR